MVKSHPHPKQHKKNERPAKPARKREKLAIRLKPPRKPRPKAEKRLISDTIDAKSGAVKSAMCYLNAALAIEKGLVAGVADGAYNSTCILPSVTRTVYATTTGGAADGFICFHVGPTLNARIQTGTTFNISGAPTAYSFENDNMYAQALAAGFTFYRTVGVFFELRCTTNALSLSGRRTYAAVPQTQLSAGFDTINSLRDSFSMGNNKAGDIMSGFLPITDQHAWRAIASTASADDLSLTIRAIAPVASSNQYELRVYAITQFLISGNTLLPATPHLGDPTAFATTVANELQKVPQYSMQRCTAPDDWLSSIWTAGKLAYHGISALASLSHADFGSTFSHTVGFYNAGNDGGLWAENDPMCLQLAGQILSMEAQSLSQETTLLDQMLSNCVELKDNKAALLERANSVIGNHHVSRGFIRKKGSVDDEHFDRISWSDGRSQGTANARASSVPPTSKR